LHERVKSIGIRTQSKSKIQNRLTTEDTEVDLSSAYEEAQEHEKNAGLFFTQHGIHSLKLLLTAVVGWALAHQTAL